MKIKFGSIVVAGSGKIGGHVASKNRGGAYLRTKVTPSNPNTSYQAAARSILASLSTGWSLLTDAQRLGWNSAVKDFATTDIFGDIKNPSGINLYVKLNANLIASGQAVISSAPAKEEVQFSQLTSATFDTLTPATSSIDFSDNVLDGVMLQIRATPIVSAGTTFVKNLYRDILYAEVDGSSVVFGTAYTAKFGSPAAGQVFYISVAVVLANGQKGTSQTFRVTAVA